MSNNMQEGKNSGFTRHAVLFGTSMVAVMGWLGIIAAPEHLWDTGMSMVVHFFDFVMLHPVVSLMTMTASIIGVVVAFFLVGVVKTNRRLDQEMGSKARG